MNRRKFLTRSAVVGFGAFAPVWFKTGVRLWVPNTNLDALRDREITFDLAWQSFTRDGEALGPCHLSLNGRPLGPTNRVWFRFV